MIKVCYNMRTVIAISLLFLCFDFLVVVSARTYEYEEQYQSALFFEKNYVSHQDLDDWSVFTLARADALTEQQKQEYLADLKKVLEEKQGVLSRNRSTEYSRRILAVTALGVDANNVYGYSLIEPLACYDFAVQQGIYGGVYTLLALDCGDYEIAMSLKGYQQTTRDNLISYLLQRQLSDGGWAVSGKYADPDTTAVVVSALTPYYKTNSEVTKALDRGVDKLAAMMGNNGAYASYGTVNAESTAQVLTAMAVFGIPLEQEAFTKEEHTILDGLFSFQLSDGSFMHAKDGGYSQMATQQALYAMNAFKRMQTGETSLYDMADVKKDTVASGEKKEIDLAGLWADFKELTGEGNPGGIEESNPNSGGIEEGVPKPEDEAALGKDVADIPNNNKGVKDDNVMDMLPDSNSVINCQSELEREMLKTPTGWEAPRRERSAAKSTIGNKGNKKSRTKKQVVTVKLTIKPHTSEKLSSVPRQYIRQTKNKKMDNAKVKKKSLFVFPSKKQEEIALLMESGVSFTVKKKGFLAPLKLKEKVALEDGDYVLCQYIDETAKPKALAKVWVKDGVLQAVIKEPGHYFVGKKVRNASVSAIRMEQSQYAGQQSQGGIAEEQMPKEQVAEGQESSSNRQPDDKKELKETGWLSKYCWLSLLLMAVMMIGCGWVCRLGKKK